LDSLFRAARKDNFVGTLLFSFVATNLAGFSVPVEVGGARLAYAAMASEAEVLTSYRYHLTTTYHLPSHYLPATYSPQVPSGSYLSAPAATSKAATRADGSGLC
tara:strand:- start:24 stop:335 length:312 start_codon:yes stop_codon:yes gene_type:complete